MQTKKMKPRVIQRYHDGVIPACSYIGGQKTLNLVMCSWLRSRTVSPSDAKGTIVNISSTDGMRGDFMLGAYVASKWGMRGLTKAAALELGRDNIRVNSIYPGPVRTPMAAGPDAAAKLAADARSLAIPRVGEPDELTRVVLFVASDEASFSTGSEFIADGGHLLGLVRQHERAEAAVPEPQGYRSELRGAG